MFITFLQDFLYRVIENSFPDTQLTINFEKNPFQSPLDCFLLNVGSANIQLAKKNQNNNQTLFWKNIILMIFTTNQLNSYGKTIMRVYIKKRFMPLNWITLGRTITDPINQIITITQYISNKICYWETFRTCSIWFSFIPLTWRHQFGFRNVIGMELT
jgi:hypothetical protein